MKSRPFLDYCRRLSRISVRAGATGTHGAAGRPAQRPAGVEQRIANSPRAVSIRANQCSSELNDLQEIVKKFPDATAGSNFLNLTAKSIFRCQVWKNFIRLTPMNLKIRQLVKKFN